MQTQDIGAELIAFTFWREILIPLLHPGLSRRTNLHRLPSIILKPGHGECRRILSPNKGGGPFYGSVLLVEPQSHPRFPAVGLKRQIYRQYPVRKTHPFLRRFHLGGTHTAPRRGGRTHRPGTHTYRLPFQR
jgi:hypothetical protein